MKSLLWCLVAAAAVAGLGDSAAAMRGVDRSALSLVSQKLNWKTSIVNEHDKHSHDVDERHFGGEALAFVTPWNNHGYAVAKRFGSKFSWVAPVWLQARVSPEGPVTVTGTHDIDAAWMAEVRKACARGGPAAPALAAALDGAEAQRAGRDHGAGKPNPPAEQSRRILGSSAWPADRPLAPACPKFVPRLAWEAAVSPQDMLRSVPVIADVIENRNFDGLTLEVPVSSATLPFIRSLTAELHKRTSAAGEPLALVQVLPPAGTGSAAIAALAAAGVDRFVVMTYDFSSRSGRVGANAPIAWVRDVAQQTIAAVANGIDVNSTSSALVEEALVSPVAAVRDAARAVRESWRAEPDRQSAAVSADGDSSSETPLAREHAAVLARALAAGRVLVGLAMYGHHDPQGNGVPEALTGNTYVALLKQHKPRMLFDRKAGEHLFRYPGALPGSRARCYYPTLWSVAQRLGVAAEQGAGVALWEIGQGLDYWYDLF